MMPKQPNNLFAMPFAQGGNYAVIPPTSAGSGRASLSAGFPVETQKPLNDGGVAPNRTDFNGILHMLSAFAFWQQSGGQFSYGVNLNYTIPNIVYHQGGLWWCLQENGPDSLNGLITPGTNEEYWITLLEALAQMGGGGSIGVPVGTIITFWGKADKCPAGYFPCTGFGFSAAKNPELYELLGSSITPDMRGLFVRGLDPEGAVDPSGAARELGSVQGDAIRNITGRIGEVIHGRGGGPNGVFYDSNPPPWSLSTGSGVVPLWISDSSINISRQVPTAPENRPKNINLLYCIKHDQEGGL